MRSKSTAIEPSIDRNVAAHPGSAAERTCRTIGFSSAQARERSHRLERRLAAILAADVAGYSRLIGTDEEGTLRRFQFLHQGILEPLIGRHRGRIVKLMGDGYLVEFQSAVDAVACAADWQRQVAEREKDEAAERRFQFRIGINLGDIVVEGGDIHGEGVNIAARLEGLADPGGIAVSDVVHQNVRSKVALAFEDLGAQRMKNIADPIHVFRVAGMGDRSDVAGTVQATRSGKPAVAILPFDNLSSDAEQQYFSDGITEDIITELSRFRQFSVISRNSSFQFRGKATDVKRIARELGARFVVEGSVRRSGSRVRITAQLIDAADDRHLWAERFDRDVTDLFDVQDRVVQAIAAGVAGRVEVAEQDRVSRMRPESMAAYDCLLRGMAHSRSIDAKETEVARQWFERALQHDPIYAPALALLALCACRESEGERSIETLDQAIELASRAVALDPNDALTHSVLGSVHLAGLSRGHGSISVATQEMETALRLNPNDADYMIRRAMLHTYSGKPELAIRLIDAADRLNPIVPDWYLSNRGFALFGLHRCEEAAAAFMRVTRPARWDHYYLAAAYAHLGKLTEARRQIEKALECAPFLTLDGITRGEWYTEESDLAYLLDGLRKAGLPER
jgi:TolB-like protein/cytochrome c-type biogenesis protein CcmH/NrfG